MSVWARRAKLTKSRWRRFFDDDLTLDLGLDESERIVGDFAPAIEGGEGDELAATSGMGDAIAQAFGMPETVWSVDEGGEEDTRGVEKRCSRRGSRRSRR